MKKLAKHLDFISKINPDGTSIITDSSIEHNSDFSENLEYNLTHLSITNKTYIATGFGGTFVVKLKPLYYIKTSGYQGNAYNWWALGSSGYTCDIRKAQKYTYEEVKKIITRDYDIAYECEYIDNLLEAHKLIIDSQYVNYEKGLTVNDLNAIVDCHEDNITTDDINVYEFITTGDIPKNDPDKEYDFFMSTPYKDSYEQSTRDSYLHEQFHPSPMKEKDLMNYFINYCIHEFDMNYGKAMYDDKIVVGFCYITDIESNLIALIDEEYIDKDGELTYKSKEHIKLMFLDDNLEQFNEWDVVN